jgi:hypothetical protein
VCGGHRDNRRANAIHYTVWFEIKARQTKSGEGHGTRIYSSCCSIFRIGFGSSGDSFDKLGQSADEVIEAAEKVGRLILETYHVPGRGPVTAPNPLHRPPGKN